MTKKQQIEFGIQECSKCKYMLRCEECVYNEKDIAELIRFEKKQARKETAREILQKLKRQAITVTLLSGMESTPAVGIPVIEAIAKQYGVEV